MSQIEYAIIFDSDLNILGKNSLLKKSNLVDPSLTSILDSSLKITWLSTGQLINTTNLAFDCSFKQANVMVETEEGTTEGIIEKIEIGKDTLWQVRFLPMGDRLLYRQTSEVFKFRTIIEGSRAGTWEWNVQTGEVVFNERWAQIIGFELEELLPISIDTWISHCNKEDLKISEKALRRHLARETPYYECEVRMKHKNGQEIWVRDFGKLMTRNANGDPEWVVGTHIDITSSKTATHELASLNTELDAMIDLSPNIIYRCKNDPLNQIDFISKDVEEVTGYSRTEIINSNMFWGSQISLSTQKEAYFQFLEWENSGRNGVFQREYRFKHKDGHYIWLSDSIRSFTSPVFKTCGYIGSISNISSQKNLELKLKNSQLRLNNAQQIGRLGHWECNLSTGEVYWSDMVHTILGYDSTKVKPSLEFFESLIADEHRQRVEESQKKALITGKYDVQHKIKHANGQLIWIHELADFNIETNTLIGTIRDITDQKVLENQLREQAITDPLTGIYNRRFYIEKLHAEFEQFYRTDNSFCLMMIDFDKFKQVNDDLGHLFGDEVLVQVTSLIAKRLRVNDVLSRIGGEEFSVILPNTTILDAIQIAETIRKQVSSKEVRYDSQKTSITVTIGLVETTGHNETMDSLMLRADDLLYKGKMSGRNRVYSE